MYEITSCLEFDTIYENYTIQKVLNSNLFTIKSNEKTINIDIPASSRVLLVDNYLIILDQCPDGTHFYISLDKEYMLAEKYLLFETSEGRNINFPIPSDLPIKISGGHLVIQSPTSTLSIPTEMTFTLIPIKNRYKGLIHGRVYMAREELFSATIYDHLGNNVDEISIDKRAKVGNADGENIYLDFWNDDDTVESFDTIETSICEGQTVIHLYDYRGRKTFNTNGEELDSFIAPGIKYIDGYYYAYRDKEFYRLDIDKEDIKYGYWVGDNFIVWDSKEGRHRAWTFLQIDMLSKLHRKYKDLLKLIILCWKRRGYLCLCPKVVLVSKILPLIVF